MSIVLWVDGLLENMTGTAHGGGAGQYPSRAKLEDDLFRCYLAARLTCTVG